MKKKTLFKKDYYHWLHETSYLIVKKKKTYFDNKTETFIATSL